MREQRPPLTVSIRNQSNNPAYSNILFAPIPRLTDGGKGLKIVEPPIVHDKDIITADFTLQRATTVAPLFIGHITPSNRFYLPYAIDQDTGVIYLRIRLSLYQYVQEEGTDGHWEIIDSQDATIDEETEGDIAFQLMIDLQDNHLEGAVLFVVYAISDRPSSEWDNYSLYSFEYETSTNKQEILEGLGHYGYLSISGITDVPDRIEWTDIITVSAFEIGPPVVFVAD